jgi:hypothetical protein
MDEVIAAFRAALGGQPDIDIDAALAPLLPAAACNGYWHGRPGLEYIARQTDLHPS